MLLDYVTKVDDERLVEMLSPSIEQIHLVHNDRYDLGVLQCMILKIFLFNLQTLPSPSKPSKCLIYADWMIPSIQMRKTSRSMTFFDLAAAQTTPPTLQISKYPIYIISLEHSEERPVDPDES